MKIKRIELYNIGPYVNKNEFEITINKNKNMVLIGGKNGAGKTTFFKAIKTCLYGCKVWGFDAPGKEYFRIINSLVNMKTQYDNSSKAYIELDLFFNDGKQKNFYTLHREWLKEKKSIIENFNILKNGEKLQDDELLDFNNYLQLLIPPDMFNFYFFDGESIADFFLGNDGKNFKNAFLKLYGLDTISLMVENFERNFKKRDGKNSAYDDYISSKTKLEECEKKYNITKDELKNFENLLDINQVKIQALQKNYEKEGGISLEDWKNLNGEIIKEESLRDGLSRWLKDIANNYLPFIILKKEMNNLSHRLVEEEESLKSSFVRELVKRTDFLDRLSKFLNKTDITADKIVKIICDSVSENDNKPSIFDLSVNQIKKLQTQIDEKNEFDVKSVLNACKEIKSSLNRSKKLRDKLAKSTIDSFGDFVDEKNKIERSIMELSLTIERKKSEVLSLEQDLLNYRLSFEKNKQKYEEQLKSKSINEMSARAIAVYTLLEDKLIRQQSQLLQEEFKKCFSSIINKDNFIDGIVVDKNINIIPYKLVDVDYSHIQNYLDIDASTKFLELFDTKYLNDINQLRLSKVENIKLPSAISAPFSQGERQVFIMSLYLALLKTSRKDIPFFIDTPFARIDSNHRSKIVSQFFLGLKNQIFILSTDEEIIGSYKEQIDKKISNKFMLKINGYGQTTILKDTYFGE
ncbi:MAG TPA: AAA family ATPase [Candidatus Onthoplasma faecipullorum]|nr:AAA family ATPase [Candidatus Onthoplasma faecipullorum]